VNIIYPKGEVYTAIYTGKDLQIPLLSYSSGAFVGVQAVETRIAWTGSINKREFYSQIASVSSLIENIIGRDFAREFVETVLLSQLTDSQALDIANTLVKNLEWIKTLIEQKRMELVKKIAYYVKKGETAEEAIERAKKESEEYVKNVENEITGFCSSILGIQLANEVEDLLKHVLNTLGPEVARWLLEVLKRVYTESLVSSHGSMEATSTSLRKVVEKVFKYPESKAWNCALASKIIKEMMKLGERSIASNPKSLKWASELQLRRLSEEEKEEIKRWLEKDQTLFIGNKVRHLVYEEIKEVGKLADYKVRDPDKIWEEVQIYGRNQRVDVVFECEEGRLIVIEVKSSTDFGNVLNQYRGARTQIDVYRSQIKRTGLYKEGWETTRNNVEVYIIIVVRIDLETGWLIPEIMEVIPSS
ncbi:MAG: hypothetical protein QXN75_04615, partial [Thermoproteota archaeon]|nr:hypothetical protein [Candidatus Brockarchaeota archaeon]